MVEAFEKMWKDVHRGRALKCFSKLAMGDEADAEWDEKTLDGIVTCPLNKSAKAKFEQVSLNGRKVCPR